MVVRGCGWAWHGMGCHSVAWHGTSVIWHGNGMGIAWAQNGMGTARHAMLIGRPPRHVDTASTSLVPAAVEALRWPEEPLRFVMVRSFSTLGEHS